MRFCGHISIHTIQNQRERKNQHGSNHPSFTQGSRQRLLSRGPGVTGRTAKHTHTHSDRWLVAPIAKPYPNRRAAETDPGIDTTGPKPDGATTDAKPYREAHTGCTTAGRIRN